MVSFLNIAINLFSSSFILKSETLLCDISDPSTCKDLSVSQCLSLTVFYFCPKVKLKIQLLSKEYLIIF
jgi:hypothetical protein